MFFGPFHRIQDREQGLKKKYFCRTLAAFCVFGECAKIFQQREIISEPKENKMQLKFLACPTGKYHSAYSLMR
jgi:hypothetical protein